MFEGKPRHYLFLAWSLVIVIIVLSLLPGNSLPKLKWQDFLQIDKIGHFMVYGLTAWSFKKYFTLTNSKRNYWFIGIALFILGVSLEWIQFSMKQGRNFDYLDMLANSIGIVCGLYFFEGVINSFSRRKSKDD